jgi:hypothetical protein
VTDEAGEANLGERPAPSVALGERLVSFKRFYRWLNLTLVQQALWPLLVLVTSARGDSPEGTPMPWYLARLGAPLLAAMLAFVYLRQAPPGQNPDRAAAEVLSPEGRSTGAGGMIGSQLRLLALGLPAMLAVARLIATPSDATVKLLLFGAAQVIAFHLIHFGVVARSYPVPDQGRAAGVVLFGCSWAISTALLTGVGSGDGSMALAFAGGLLIGWVVGAACLAIREGLGGFWPAAALHWFVVYLIFGFTG